MTEMRTFLKECKGKGYKDKKRNRVPFFFIFEKKENKAAFQSSILIKAERNADEDTHNEKL